jgi:uncharacterized protein (TIGR02217 family)
MTFLEQRLDTKITHGASGGPTVPGRTKTYLPNGKLYQDFTASTGIHRYDVSHGVRSRADFQAVLDLFYVVMFTPYEGFRFKDWRDYQGLQTNTRLRLIAGSTWQLQRRHVFGGVEFLRDITKPVASTVTVWRTRSAVVSAAIAVVDYTTGIVTITGHVDGDTYTWTGEFDMPVTFTDDTWVGDLEVNTVNLWVTSNPIKLEEIR